MRYARRRPRRFTAADWPFYRPGVNPVAADSPPALVEIARIYLDLKQHLREEPWITRAELLERLNTAGNRNRYHRVDEQLVGLFDRLNREPELSVIPAFSRLG